MSSGKKPEVGRSLVDLRLVTREQLSTAISELSSPTFEDLLRYFERRLILTPFQINKLERGERTGYFLGRFKLQYKISAGTFARVFRGVSEQTGEVVAIKVLRGRHTIDQENIKNFHREAKVMESLVHPNIARVIEVGTDSECFQHYIAMEFVEGGNLREILNIRKKIQADQIISLGKQMLSGLEYALSKGVTHRDIKPTNILFSTTGQVKWVDFGLAGLVEKTATTVQYVTEQRTVDYAGLEKATGASKGDPRSDIFFMGVVFFQMLTGEHPLPEAKDKNARMLRTRFDQIRSVRDFSDVPPGFVSLVDKMLSFRPESRYQTYETIIRDLETAAFSKSMSPEISSMPLPRVGPPIGHTTSDKPRIIIIHKTQKIQDILRAKLLDLGYHVALTTDISRAVALMGMQKTDCLVIDLDTTGEEGVDEYHKLLRRARYSEKPVPPALFFANQDQKSWLQKLVGSPFVALRKEDLTLGPVYRAIMELAPGPDRRN